MFTNIEDFQKFSKDQVEAATKAATLATKNLQQIASESTDFSKKSVEQGAAAEQYLGKSRIGARIASIRRTQIPAHCSDSFLICEHYISSMRDSPRQWTGADHRIAAADALARV